jgi:hypothetical protein
LLRGHLRLAARHDQENANAVGGRDLAIGRLVDIGRHPDLYAVRKIEALRHHADDGMRQALKRDRLADDLRITAEPIPPEVVAQDRDRRLSGALVSGADVAAHQGGGAHHAEERVRGGRAMELFRMLDPGPVEYKWPTIPDLFEDPVLLAQAVVVRRHSDLFVGGAGSLADPIDAVRVRVRKGADQD